MHLLYILLKSGTYKKLYIAAWWGWYTVFSRPPAQRKTRLQKAGGVRISDDGPEFLPFYSLSCASMFVVLLLRVSIYTGSLFFYTESWFSDFCIIRPYYFPDIFPTSYLDTAVFWWYSATNFKMVRLIKRKSITEVLTWSNWIYFS